MGNGAENSKRIVAEGDTAILHGYWRPLAAIPQGFTHANLLSFSAKMTVCRLGLVTPAWFASFGSKPLPGPATAVFRG